MTPRLLGRRFQVNLHLISHLEFSHLNRHLVKSVSALVLRVATHGAVVGRSLRGLLAATLPSLLTAQPISPRLVGSNLWYADRTAPSTSPAASAMTLAGQAGLRFIRIGGNDFDGGMPSNSTLLTWVNRIRAIGAEPIIQVSEYGGATTAAATVQFLNVTSGAHVTYWSIGNEPWLSAIQAQTPDPTEAQIASTIATYFKADSAAMKAVDPTIKIFGVDSEDFQGGLHTRLFGGSNDIAGKVPGKNYYYCDGISWHRYPQATGIDPAYEGLDDIRTRIEDCRSMLDSVNAAENRSGPEALLWGIGEFNSKNGTAVHSWGNGQMFAGVYGLAMKHGANHACSWSLRESDGDRSATDFGLLDGAGLVPRPSYWHSQLVAKYFTGNYLEGTPSISSGSSSLLVYGAADDTSGQLSVMILNRGSTARPYTLHLNTGATFAATGATALNVDASRPETYSDTIPARGTHVVVFRRDCLTKVTYTNADFIAGVAPQTSVTPTSPLSGLLDGFDNYDAFSQQGYWSTLNVGSGQAAVSGGKLVLRAADSAYASTTVANPLTSQLDFFQHGFAIVLDGFDQTFGALASDSSQFRLDLNSTANRSYGADDSVALRINPHNIRLGYKINQPAVHGELRAGTATTEASLLDMEYAGTLRAIRLSLEPTATAAAGISTILYRLQLDGSFGRICRAGTFTAARAEWGAAGDCALVLESRRESASAGGTGSFTQAAIDTVYCQPLGLDGFDGYQDLTGQVFWQSLLVGASSTVQEAGGTAVLTARAASFASAALAGMVIPELNFFQRGYSLDLHDLALTTGDLAPGEAIFRLSLNSTAQRSFTTPDSLTLRLTPNSVRLGYKLDQPGVDAELRNGTATTTAALIDAALPASVTGLRLTLQPAATAGPATPVCYALRLTTSAGDLNYTGTFAADLSRWGAAGDSSMVLESRRASTTTGDITSFMQVAIGAVNVTPLPDDLLESAPTFTAWRLREFATEELDNPATSGSSATPAGDGVSNLLKYAFGLAAKSPAAASMLPELDPLTGSPPAYFHQERAGASDLSYQVEASSNLVTWNVPVVEVTRATAAGGWTGVWSRASLPANAARVFYRTRVANPTIP